MLAIDRYGTSGRIARPWEIEFEEMPTSCGIGAIRFSFYRLTLPLTHFFHSTPSIRYCWRLPEFWEERIVILSCNSSNGLSAGNPISV
jgi:hypothetical protein